MQIHLKEKTWNWHAHTITLLDPWSSDRMFRLDVQTWVQTWESSIQDWRLKILQGSSWRICNPGLKIEDSPGLLLGNLQSRREPLMLNPQSWIEDSPRRVPGNLQSSIFSPGWKISQQESWRIFNLQSWIEDPPTSKTCSNFVKGPRLWPDLCRASRLSPSVHRL